MALTFKKTPSNPKAGKVKAPKGGAKAAKDKDAKNKKPPKKIKAEKTTGPKIKRNAFKSGSRFVLFVGDEGAILLYTKKNVVISRQFVPDASEQNLEELRTSLDKDTKAPIMLAIDSMDQSFVQQTLPPVSAMSVKKLITKRLERDFGANDIKGAITLGREKTGRKDWNFLMVSLERSRPLEMWLGFVQSLPNRFMGIFLVSVETELVVKNLEKAMGIVPKKGTGARWKFFVSHNKVGGFRQVVLRDGRIIFTRMSQPIGESTPEVIAGNIEQEMQSTLEYMKRLTYNVADGLDVYIVASSAIKPFVDKSKFITNTFTVMTPFEVAEFLGIEGATQPTDQFGDVILAASIAASPKHILTLNTPESKKFDMFYSAFKAQRVVGALLAVAILGYSGSIALDIYDKFEKASDLETAKRTHQKTLDDLKAEIKKSNFDIDKLGEVMELYQLLLKQNQAPFHFLNKLEKVIKLPIVIKAMDWSVDDKVALGNPNTANKVTVLITLTFPGVTDVDTFKAVSKKVLDALKLEFKNYEITFGKLPSKYTESENLSVTYDSKSPTPVVNKEVPDVTLTFKELDAAGIAAMNAKRGAPLPP